MLCYHNSIFVSDSLQVEEETHSSIHHWLRLEFLVLTLLVTVVAMNVAGLEPGWYGKGGVLKCFLYGSMYDGMVSIDPSGKLAMVDVLCFFLCVFWV